MYGLFRSLLKCKRDYPLSDVIVVWDGGHKNRDELSKEGVKQGIIPQAYKENRLVTKDENTALVRWQMDHQIADVQKGLSLMSVQNVLIPGYEADDVIASYVLERSDPCVVVTSDKDYYQVLGEGVVLVDPIKAEKTTLDSFHGMYGLWPDQWADVGALAGDLGDNIFGVPGIGEKTAVKMIVEHHDINQLFVALKEKQQSGLKMYKTEESALAHEARVRLAYQLKLIDDNVPGRHRLQHPCLQDSDKLKAFFGQFGFDSLVEHVKILAE
jgi:DNA polymerase-1